MRRELIGQGIHYLHPFFILAQLRWPGQSQRMMACPTRWEDATQEQFEMRFAEMISCKIAMQCEAVQKAVPKNYAEELSYFRLPLL